MISTPCTAGKSGINCQNCPKGYYKTDLIEKKCSRCVDNHNENHVFIKYNNCKIFKCNQEKVNLVESINPGCVTIIHFFASIILNWKNYLLILYGITTILFIVTAIKESRLLNDEDHF